jgi:hypothetical protein
MKMLAHNCDSIVSKWRTGNNSFGHQSFDEQYDSMLQDVNIYQET